MSDLDAIKEGIRAELVSKGVWQRLKVRLKPPPPHLVLPPTPYANLHPPLPNTQANLRTDVHCIVSGSGLQETAASAALKGNEKGAWARPSSHTPAPAPALTPRARPPFPPHFTHTPRQPTSCWRWWQTACRRWAWAPRGACC